ncbi:Adapter protein unc-53 [Aphelenchoides besseyi]|nr:Adapter protein unc-53 [Aphelenchoides besseyi]
MTTISTLLQSNGRSPSNDPKPPFTNQQLIPIYTDWVNRYLEKQQLQPIHDLTYDLREPKALVGLISAVTVGCRGTSHSVLLCALNAEDPIERTEKCLHYLSSIGVNVSNVRARDLYNGHLGEILALLFALSHFKQQQKALNSTTFKPPHSTIVTVGHANVVPLQSTSSVDSSLKSSQSLIRKPTTTMSSAAISKTPKPLGSTSSLVEPSTGARVGASKLLPPTSNTRKLAPPSVAAPTSSAQPLTNRTTRLPASGTNRLKPPVATVKTPQRSIAGQSTQTNVRLPSTTLQNATPTTSLLLTSCSSTASSSVSASSVKATISAQTTASGLKPPRSVSRAIKPPVALKHRSSSAPRPAIVSAVKTTPSIEPIANTNSSAPEPQKMLKFFGKTRRSSASPVISKDERSNDTNIQTKSKTPIAANKLNRSAALRAPSSGPLSVAVTEKISEPTAKLPNCSVATTSLLRPPSSTRTADPPKRTSKSSSDDSAFGDDLHSGSSSSPAALSPRLSETPPPKSNIPIVEDSGISSDATSEPTRNSQERKPTLAVRGITAPNRIVEEIAEVVENSTDEKTSSEQSDGQKAQSTTVVGVVNPLVTEAKPTSMVAKPAVPVRKTSRLTSVPKDDQDVPPAPSLRIPGMSRATNTTRPPVAPTTTGQSDANTNDVDYSRSASEMCSIDEASLMRSPMRRTNRMNTHRREFNDSCDDSSSISTDVSQDFDDVSTDDLTGSSLSDHPMAAATSADYRKAESTVHRPRTSGGHHADPPRIHQRRLVEQQQSVVEELLQRSRTSQRGIAYNTNNTETLKLSVKYVKLVILSVDWPFFKCFGSSFSPNKTKDEPAGYSAIAQRSSSTVSTTRFRKPARSSRAFWSFRPFLTVEDASGLKVNPKHSRRIFVPFAFRFYGVGFLRFNPTYSRVYHTLHGAPLNGRLSSQTPQLLLSHDGDTLSVARPSTARPTLRTLANNQPPPSYHDHTTAAQYQQNVAGQSPFHSHSLDRHGHLKHLTSSTNDLPYDSVGGQHRFSVAPPISHQLDGHNVYAAVSEIGRGSNRAYRGYVESMAGQSHGRAHAVRGSQLRSASLSSSNNSSLMSRSMVLYESDSNLSSPSEPNNNHTTVGSTTRERLYAEMMAAIRSRTPPRSSRRLPPFSVANTSRMPSPSSQQRSNGALSARLPPTSNGSEYANGMNLQLHKLTTELNCSPRAPASHLMRLGNNGVNYTNGSQLSLTSSLGSTYSMPEDAYEGVIRQLNNEMANCREQITNLNEKKDDFHQIIHLFDSKLEVLMRQVEKLQKKSAKPNDIENLVKQIEDLRQLSTNAGVRVNRDANGVRSQSIDPGDLRKHPSVESVNSYASMKTAKTIDKNNGFSRNGTKKGWIRSSFTRAFAKGKKSKSGTCSESEQSPLHRPLGTIVDSTNALDETEDGLLRLQLQLQEKERQLSDVQLEAVGKAREVELLRDTVNRLKNENKVLKNTTLLLERRAMRSESRCDSRQSLSTCYHEDEAFYETPPSLADRSCSSSSSSKRSSGGLNARVVVNIDIAGNLDFRTPGPELNIGFIPLPSVHTNWTEIDQQLCVLMDEYLRRVDPEMTLGLSSFEPCIGYQMTDGSIRDCLNGATPSQPPVELITPASIIRLRLRGATQNSMDSLVLESLFPAETIQKLLRLLLDSRRLVVNGPTGSGKSKLLRYLARYLAAQRNISSDQIHDIAFPTDEADKRFTQVQQELTRVLKSEEESIVLIDNMPRKRLDVICSALAAADEHFSADIAGRQVHGPFFLITLNRTESANLHLQQMQVAHNVHCFSIYCQIEPIKGFLGRYLRRRIAQDDYTGKSRCNEQLEQVINFLNHTLQAINEFIKNVNQLDTIGPRIFLACPLSSMDKSREWFIQLYNGSILPFLAKVFRESDSFTKEWRDPKDVIAEHWPWLDGNVAEKVLNSVAAELEKPSQSTSSNSSVTSAMLSI